MKSYKFFVFLVLMLGTVTASAQWAGKDQEVFRNNDNSQTVTLSVTSANPKACYKWTGPNIQGDPNQPSVTAKPQQAQQTYVCQRISAEGVEEDEVLVKVIDSVKIVSVAAKKKCYSTTDNISTSDFDIVTEPTGYENQVTVSPTALSGLSTITVESALGKRNADGTLTATLTFSLTVHDHTSTKKLPVVVVDPDLGLSPSIGIDIATFVSTCKKIEELEQKMTKIAQNMEALGGRGTLKGLRAGVDISDFDCSIGGVDINYLRWACCNNVRSQVVVVNWGGVTGKIGASITVPFPIAAIPGLNFYLNAQASVAVGLTGCTFTLSHNKDCASTELTIGVAATVSGAAGICALSPDILSAQLGLEGTGSSSIVWKVTDKKVIWRPLQLTGSVVGQVLVAGGLVTKKVKWTFLKIQIGE